MNSRYVVTTSIRYYKQLPPERDAQGVPIYGLLRPEHFVMGKEPPHVALANLLLDDKALAAFTRRYGLVFVDPAQLQDLLRKAWRGDKEALEYLTQKNHRASVCIRPDGVSIIADDAGTCACLLFLHDCLNGKTAICASPDCPAPYFLRARKGQKFCSHRCATLISVRRLRERQKKAMKLLEAVERARRHSGKSSRRAKR
jgi:hypothetical protein